MAKIWKEIKGGATNFLSAAKMMPGQMVEGKYTEKGKGEMYGEDRYTIETEDGKTVLSGCGHLNFLMQSVPVGSEVRITYKGKEKVKSGKMMGKEAHVFAVQVAGSDSDEDAPAPEDFARGEDFPI